MQYKNKEIWDKIVEANNHEKDPTGYGLAIIEYAEKWANLMEEKMKEGQKLKDVWKKASFTANDDGITGFMYGMAVNILFQTWEHGSELRKLHNLDIQIKNEGEMANKTEKVVLNPAIITINK